MKDLRIYKCVRVGCTILTVKLSQKLLFYAFSGCFSPLWWNKDWDTAALTKTGFSKMFTICRKKELWFGHLVISQKQNKLLWHSLVPLFYLPSSVPTFLLLKSFCKADYLSVSSHFNHLATLPLCCLFLCSSYHVYLSPSFPGLLKHHQRRALSGWRILPQGSRKTGEKNVLFLFRLNCIFTVCCVFEVFCITTLS